MLENNDRFDQDIKSMMENAEEQVPSRVWNAVSSRLDTIQVRPHRISRIWWTAGTSLAAAAAIALAVIFSGRDLNSNKQHILTKQDDVAVNGAPETEETSAQETPVATVQLHNHSGLTAQASKPEQDTEDAADEEVVAAETEQETVVIPKKEGTDVGETSQSESKKLRQVEKRNGRRHGDMTKSTQAPDAFAQMAFEDQQNASRSRVALMVSGIVQSNGNPSTSSLHGRLSTIAKAPTKTSITELSKNPTYGVPVSFGIGTRVYFAKRWSVGAGIDLSYLTKTFTGTYTEVDQNGNIKRSISSDIDNYQHYIGIPVDVFFNVIQNDAVNFYAFGGGTLEKCVRNQYRIQNSPSDIHYHEKVNGMQASVAAGIGVEFKIVDQLGIFVDPSLHYYFDCNQPGSIRTAQPFMMNLEVGLRVDLQ